MPADTKTTKSKPAGGAGAKSGFKGKPNAAYKGKPSGDFKGKPSGDYKGKPSGDFKGKKRPAPSDKDANKSFMDQKVAKKQRKMQRPHYEMVSRAKEIWNIIRERDVDKTKRTKLVDELYQLVQGKVYDIAAKHDASRVIQALLKFGTPAQRSSTIEELKEHMLELAKMQYGCFLVQKMIRYGNKQDRAMIVKVLTGHVVTLATHNIAANVLEYAQEFFTPAQLSGLKLEFYGKEFAYFKSENKKNLKEIVADNRSKRNEILKHVASILNRMVDKQLLGLAFVQSLLWDYFSNADHDDVMQMVVNVRDASLALLATRNGARVVNKCISLGDAKDRKRIIKCLKDKVLEATNHPSGYLVIQRLLDVVDDTVLVQKSVLSELNDHLFAVAMHATGRKVLLQLLSPLSTKYLSPDDIELLAVPTLPNAADASQPIVNYKKEPATRREELLKGLLPKLEEMCAEHMVALLRSKEGRDVAVEVLKRSSSVNAELAAALVDALSAPPANDSEEPLHLDDIGHLALRRVIAETVYAAPLLDAAVDNLAAWAKTNRGSFVVLAFLEAQHGADKARKTVASELKSQKAALTKLAAKQTGTKLLLDKLA